MLLTSLRFACLISLAIASVSQAFAAPCIGAFERPAYLSRSHFCVLGQMIEDAYAPGNMVPCSEVEVDHLISLRQAWESGVCGEDLKRLANDPRNLRLTYWRTNRQKGFLPPEQFSKKLPAPVAKQVMRDSTLLMREYGVRTREQAVSARMLAYAAESTTHISIRKSAIIATIREAMTTTRVGARVIVYVGKRAVGYTVAASVGISVVMASAWAVNWLTSPSQDELMKQRAAYFGAILAGEE